MGSWKLGRRERDGLVEDRREGERSAHTSSDRGREMDSWNLGWTERDGLMDARMEGER
jgi:hypothetical protein